MGAPRLRPAERGPVIDGPAIAALVGCPVTEVYELARQELMPAPLNARYVSNPRRWRWSRRLVAAWLEERWTPPSLGRAS